MEEKSKKGCLVIHGLTGTPVIMKSVVERLEGAGFLINAPLLPGHGTRPGDLCRVKWQDWWEAVVEAYFDLKSVVESVSCVGISLGSLLALRLAEQMGLGVSAVVAMGTPLVLTFGVEHIAYPLVRFTPARWFYKYSKKDWVGSVADATGREFYIRHSYDKIAVNSVFEVFKLKKLVREDLNRIISPLFIVHGKDDKVAPPRNIEILRTEANPAIIDTLILPGSRHVITLDYDRGTAAKAVVAFLERF